MNGPDTQAPITMLTCDGSACASRRPTPARSTVSFKATDPGRHRRRGDVLHDRRVDADDRRARGPRQPFTISGPTRRSSSSRSTTAGNVRAGPDADGAGAPNARSGHRHCGRHRLRPDGTRVQLRAGHRYRLPCRAHRAAAEGVDAVLPLGDNQYDCGGTAAFAQSLRPDLGRHEVDHATRSPATRTTPTSGGTDCPAVAGAGYYQYFGAGRGRPDQGLLQLRPRPMARRRAEHRAVHGSDPRSVPPARAQEQWLKQDLAANTRPARSPTTRTRGGSTASGSGGNDHLPADLAGPLRRRRRRRAQRRLALVRALRAVERSGSADAATGVREFIVGTGGAGLDTPGDPAADQPETQRDDARGLQHDAARRLLRLGFVPDEGTFTDSGTANCHGKPTFRTAPTTASPATARHAPGSTTAGAQVTLAGDGQHRRLRRRKHLLHDRRQPADHREHPVTPGRSPWRARRR